MKTITKDALKSYLDFAINYAVENDGETIPLEINPKKGLKVYLKYVMPCGVMDGGIVHMFTMIDPKDPWTKGSHSYPKMYDGDIDAFYEEFNRELAYISSLHTKGTTKKQYINIER